MDFGTVYNEVKMSLANVGIKSNAECDFLIAEALNKTRGEIYFQKTISASDYKKIKTLLAKRLKHIPLDKIIRKKEFFGLDFYVDNNVLSPRPETELLVEQALKHIKTKDVKVLDVGTGSGCIAVSLAKATHCDMTAIEISKKALKIAQGNAKKHKVKINFVLSDMFKKVYPDKKFDIIISNPPYIVSSDIAKLDAEVKNHDPMLALDGGKDGLKFYRIIAEQAPKFLNKGGKLFLEIGITQGGVVGALLKKDFCDIKIINDYNGVPRIVMATKKDYLS